MKNVIKSIIIVLCLLFVIWILILFFNEPTYNNGIPKYFLEPDGYIIAKIKSEDDYHGLLSYTFTYGYIKEDDYENYINGTLTGNLVVKNPYEEGKQIVKPIDKITSIETGVYKDYRGKGY